MGNSVLEPPYLVVVHCSKCLRKHDERSSRRPAGVSSFLVTSQTVLCYTHSRHSSAFSAVETCDPALNQRASFLYLEYFYELE
jgi:hypothetical protein